jgi:O-antigen/teichoic acid export membrane protein
MDIRKRVIQSSVWSVAGTLAYQLISFATFTVLARILQPSEIGLVALCSVFIELGRLIAYTGITDAVIRWKHWNDASASTAFWTVTVFAILLAVVLGAGIAPVADHLVAGLGVALSVLSIGLIFDGLSAIHFAKIRRELRLRILTATYIPLGVAEAILSVLLALKGYGMWAIILPRVALSPVHVAISWIAAGWLPTFTFCRHDFREFLHFGVRILSSQLVNFVTVRVPETAIGFFAGPSAIAYYRAGLRLSDLAVQITVYPLQGTSLPVLAQLPSLEDMRRASDKFLATASLIACPLFLGLAATANDVVSLLFGASWASSGYVLTILSVCGVPLLINGLAASMFTALGRADIVMRNSLVAGLLAVLLVLACAPVGLYAVALSVLLRECLMAAVALATLTKVAGVSTRALLGCITPPLLCAFVMAVLVVALTLLLSSRLGTASRLLVVVLAGAIFYVGALRLFASPFVRRQIPVLQGVIPGLAFRFIERLF